VEARYSGRSVASKRVASLAVRCAHLLLRDVVCARVRLASPSAALHMLTAAAVAATDCTLTRKLNTRRRCVDYDGQTSCSSTPYQLLCRRPQVSVHPPRLLVFPHSRSVARTATYRQLSCFLKLSATKNGRRRLHTGWPKNLAHFLYAL